MPRGWMVALSIAVLWALVQAPESGPGDAQAQTADISGDPDKPRRNFRVRHPARLNAQQAAEIYRELVEALSAGYARSGHPVAEHYREWRRANTAPYLSSTHGNVYLNNYANDAAEAYGRQERAATLPVGSIVAKDSFIVERGGEVRPGALFVMEKMPVGFNYVSGDWRYSMIMPDGVLFGETLGEDSERVEYCIGCHLAVENQDHLYFVPREFRVGP